MDAIIIALAMALSFILVPLAASYGHLRLVLWILELYLVDTPGV
jgi:hypothetical protein